MRRPTWISWKVPPGGSLAFAPVLMLMFGLMLGLGLAACSKKSRSDSKQAAEPVPADSPANNGMSAMSAMDGITSNDPSLRLRTMESPIPHPDGGVATPKGNKGMIGQMKLVDPTE